MKKFMTLVAIILAMIVGQSLQTTAQITAGRYGVAQVFDCQRSPAYPAAGQLFTASGLARPYKDVGGQYTLGTGEYIQFFYVGGSCNSGVVGINRYNSGGGFLETISAGGRIYGLANQGFLYVSTHGDFGTFVSNSVGYNYGSSASFVTNIGLADCSQLSSYTATSTILAPGETAGGGTSTYTISGSAGVASATISYTGGSTTADGSGAYSFTVSSGWNGTSSASKTGYTFSANKTYSNVTSNQTSQNFTATLNTYTISGNAGIGSALITYTGGTTTADGSGAYSFTVNYGWSGTSSASKAGYTFSASKTYLNVASSYASQDFSATLNTYTISGNAGVASASITYTGGATTANASGLYSFTVNYGWSGTSSASKAGYTFSADKTYTNVTSNQTSQDFTATLNTYTISGNAGIGSALITYTGGTTTANASGVYSFTVNYDWSGTSSASKAGYTFSADKTYTNVTSNQTSQDFTATLNTYTISGNAGVASASITYTGGATTANASGLYSFTVNYGWSGTSSASKAGYTFSADKTYTNVAANQASQDFTATAIIYTLTYDGNGSNLRGSSPVNTPYTIGVTVTVANTGTLLNPNFVFTAWNTAADGTGASYNAGETFGMPTNDVTLYAQWVPVPCTKLFEFTGSTGAIPNGSLVSDGTYLYGMTYNGGTLNKGVIFKIKTDGTGYAKLMDFDGAKGANPYGSLLLLNNVLYGLTYNGGLSNKGVAFKINPDGTGFTKLVDFDGATKGSNPYNEFITDGTNLYTTTYTGGTSSKGTVIKMTTAGVVTKLVNFDGALKGANPKGKLVLTGGFLYGMTYYGGTVNMGTAFKVNTTDGSFAKILNFNGYSLPNAYGSYPLGSFATDGTYLYGMTSIGGTKNKGTAFKIHIATNVYTKIVNFDNTTNGSNPQGGFIVDDGYIYGMTYLGGAYGLGVLFKIKIATSTYYKMLDFDGTNYGSNPTGSLIVGGGYLYGMTTSRGPINMGSIFKYQIAMPSAGNFGGTDMNTNPVLVNNNDNIQSVTLQSDNSDREKFVVFPNPAKESINVLYFSETATRGAVKILDLQGRTIQHLEVEFIEGLNSKTLNTAELSKGIYFVSVGAKIQKFVIE